ncbi:hypothetical protein [Streptomyces gilvus]|uniref:hypothetical protein n=1 Tax=Streptomyces gilvus TaxID=2920937 RepID=UPI001F0D3196|nr:hypothetical protein [Streptomyces sp. CME 23]MCH5672980.1 hypothetical protein [Streptomyces sp. CME 23]
MEHAGPPLPPDRAKAIDAVAHAAGSGDWRSAASYVEGAGRDWDERWSRLELLVHLADKDDAWLRDWRAAEPKDCVAATVHAQLLLQGAWSVRGTGYAHTVSPDLMSRFRALLRETMDAAEKAATLDADDPGPWVVMITAARGLRFEHDRFQRVWLELFKRAPHHYMGHRQALEYWCAKWAGSHKLMMDFAERAVHRAPAGSPLAGIYLHALDELASRPRDATLPSTPAAKEMLESIAHSFDQVIDDYERLPRLRHLLAHYLVEAQCYDTALEQFRRLGPWCGAEPWTRHRSPARAFDLTRGIAARRSRQVVEADTSGNGPNG